MDAVAEDLSVSEYIPLTHKSRWMLAFAGLLLFAVSFLPVSRFGSFLNVAIDRSEAKRTAERFLEHQRVDWRTFKSVIYYEQALDPLAAQYILKYSEPDTLNHIYSQKVKVSRWVARFYQPLEQEEYLVFIDPRDGRILTFTHKLSENAPGASLEKQEAQQTAVRFLKSQGIALDRIELKEANSEKRKARQDYSFVWEMKEDRVRESSIRLDVRLCGDQITGFYSFVKVPEEWQRIREKTPFFQIVTYGARFLVFGFLGGWAFWAFLQNARRGRIRWRSVIVIALGLVALQVLTQLNALPVLFRDYDTSVTPRIFIVDVVSRFLITAIFQLLFFLLLIGLVVSLYPTCQVIWRRYSRSRFAEDALWLAVSLTCAAFGLATLEAWFVQHFHQYALVPSLPYLEEINHWIPALSALGRALQVSIIYPSVLGIYLFVLVKAVEKPVSRLLFLLLTLLSLQPPTAVTLGEWISALLIHAVLLVPGLYIVRVYVRGNILSCIAIFFVLALSRSAYEFIVQSSPFLRRNGVFLLLVAALFLLNLIRDSRIPRVSPFSEVP